MPEVCLRPAQFLPEVRAHQLPLGKAIEAEFLVRRMSIVIRQRQPEQQRVGVEDFFKFVHDRNRATFAHEDRGRAES